MKTIRLDIKRDNKKVYCPNSTNIGYSKMYLKKGDLFSYKEWYTDETYHYRTAISHGRVKPNDNNKWFVLAQATNDLFSFTYERWINPEDIIETIPADRINPNIKAFFVDWENQW